MWMVHVASSVRCPRPYTQHTEPLCCRVTVMSWWWVQIANAWESVYYGNVMVMSLECCANNREKRTKLTGHLKLMMTLVQFLLIVCCGLGLSRAQTNHSGSFFPCQIPTPSNYTTTSVHRLRPSDIRVIGALGDSLTAGFEALAVTIYTNPLDYRGVSWSGGKSRCHQNERGGPISGANYYDS